MDNKKQVAALYVRVSTEEQAREGYSIPAQIEVLKQYCDLYNIKLHKIYKDLGLSGKNINGRPGLNQLLDDSSSGLFNCVIVWKISRLSRNLKDLLYLVDSLECNNVSFISYSEKFDTSIPVGRMTLQILGSIAEFERNSIIENVKLGLDQRAKEGKWTGNHVYGYDNVDKELVINENEAEVIKRIYSMYLNQNIGCRKIAFTLNNEGIRTKRNSLFGHDYILRILSNPVYKGCTRHKTHNKVEYYEVKGIHIPIIDETIFNKAQEKISRLKVIKSQPSNNHILTGLLKCGQCGSNMVICYGKDRGKTYRYYKCSLYNRYGSSACSSNTINADKIENIVLQKLAELIYSTSIINSVTENIIKIQSAKTKLDGSIKKGIDDEINQLKYKKNKYFKLFESNKISPEILSEKLSELQEKLNGLTCKKTLTESKSANSNIIWEFQIDKSQVNYYLKNLFKFQKTISLEDKRLLLSDIIKSIHLDKDKNISSIEFKFQV